MSYDDDNFFDGIFSPGVGSIDTFLEGRELDGGYYNSVRDLVKAEMSKEGRLTGFDLPLTSGIRVAFIGDLEALLTYGDNYPAPGMGGTVVTVRSAQGDTTLLDSRSYILWDDGIMRSILAKHMMLERKVEGQKMAKIGPVVRIVTGSLGQVAHFFCSSSTRPNELVHKATQDIWSFGTDNTGNYVIERLYNESGKTLKD